MKYTGKAWKHHIVENFIKYDTKRHPNGAGKGATIFMDYDKMLSFLEKDGREWFIAELDLTEEELIYDYGNDWMATTQRIIHSEHGFKEIKAP